MRLKKPFILKSGDKIHVVASSSPFDKKNFLDGVKTLEEFGFQVSYRKDIFDKQPYLAGSDARRFQELKNALADKTAAAVFFARGGYGASRLIPFLDKIKIAPAPKIIAGFSDVTALHLYFKKRLGWNGFYAPMIGGNSRQFDDHVTTESFRRTFMEPEPLGKLSFKNVVIVKKGKMQGELAGGCLTLVANSLGTPSEINTDNKILFLEDVHEKPYQIDRLLTHLKLAGKFKKCRGIVFGYLSGPNPFEHYEATVADVLKEYDFPVLMNFPTGHEQRFHTLPFGLKTEINSRDRSLAFLENALAEK